MGLGCGPPRKLTDTQIRQVLSWHACRQKFRAHHGSVHQLAARLGVNTDVIYCCIARYCRKGNRPLRVKGAVARRGPRRGRPPSLSDMKVRAVEAWYRRHNEFVERTGTAQALARRMGVSVRTIHDCIRRRGRYIQLSESSLNPTSSAGISRGADAEIQWRSVLLRRWGRSPR
jgi:transposase